MSTFLDFSDTNLESAIEPKAVDDGEYALKIVDWKTTDDGEITKEDTNGNPYIMPVMEIIECPEAEYAKPITHFIRLPHDGMTKKEKNEAMWNLRVFLEAFELDTIGRIDIEDTLGKTADAFLVTTPDTGFGEQNRVKRFINPK